MEKLKLIFSDGKVIVLDWPTVPDEFRYPVRIKHTPQDRLTAAWTSVVFKREEGNTYREVHK
jgi:hypothetical protein